MYRKNRQAKIYFNIIDKDTGNPVVSGNPVARVIRDGSLVTTDTLSAGSNYITDSGVWFYDIATSAMNGDVIGVGITHSDGVPQTVSINTFEYDMTEIYNGITTLQAGVTVGGVGTYAVSSPTDFMASTTGLSTFDHTTDFITIATAPLDVNIISVAGSGVTIGDFRAQNITASVGGVVQANVVQVGTTGISGIEDFYTNTSGLSTFDSTTDFVKIDALGITAGGLATSAVTKIVSGVFDQIVDGSITFDKVMEMLLSLMAGKVAVTDNGSERTITWYKRDDITQLYVITVAESDSIEGQRGSGGAIT